MSDVCPCGDPVLADDKAVIGVERDTGRIIDMWHENCYTYAVRKVIR